MQLKIVFFLFATFLFVQGTAASPRVKRDTPTEIKPDMFEDLKKNVNSFFQDNLKPDKVWDSITTNLKELGEKVQSGAQDFAKTIQQGSNNLFNSKAGDSQH